MQLVARNIEDFFITGDPEITFFKIVYRRHVSFSMSQLMLNFKGKTTFGRKVTLPIRRKGDLLGCTTLIFNLPEIEMVYKEVKNIEIVQLLRPHGINWTYGLNNPHDLFNVTLLEEENGILRVSKSL